MLLPYIDQAPLYNSLDFNYYWFQAAPAGPDNRTVVRSTIISAFSCPSDPQGAKKPQADSSPISYCLSGGPASAWNVSVPPGPFAYISSVRLRDFVDGTSNTITMSECGIGNNTAKRDNTFRVSTAGALTSTGTYNNRVFDTSAANIAAINTYYNNCKSQLLTSTLNSEDDDAGRFWSSGRDAHGPWFNTLMTPNKGPHCDADTSPTTIDLKTANSFHTGGVHVLMGDGTVRFVSDNIDQIVWISSGTHNGNEAKSLE